MCTKSLQNAQPIAERRSHPRAPLGTDAQVISADGRYLCTVLDVCAGGVAIRCEPDVQLNQFVQIDFFLPDVSQWFSSEAMVVRNGSTSDPGTWGLAFHAPDCWTVSHIQTFVAGRLAPCLT